MKHLIWHVIYKHLNYKPRPEAEEREIQLTSDYVIMS